MSTDQTSNVTEIDAKRKSASSSTTASEPKGALPKKLSHAQRELLNLVRQQINFEKQVGALVRSVSERVHTAAEESGDEIDNDVRALLEVLVQTADDLGEGSTWGEIEKGVAADNAH